MGEGAPGPLDDYIPKTIILECMKILGDYCRQFIDFLGIFSTHFPFIDFGLPFSPILLLQCITFLLLSMKHLFSLGAIQKLRLQKILDNFYHLPIQVDIFAKEILLL